MAMQLIQARTSLWRVFAPFWRRANRLAWLLLGAGSTILAALCVITPFDYADWGEIFYRVATLAAILGSACAAAPTL